MANQEQQDATYDYGTSGKEEIPVQKDDEIVEDPVNAETADSDEQLGKFHHPLTHTTCSDPFAAQDEKDAIDTSNIVDGRTRGAKPSGGYAEPGDDEGLPGPGDSGVSAVSGGVGSS